ncbi:MAG TPA: helix-turn-helix domain-containing protein, partial [archaeon]|nr:helix-turn-helix domain-containing protein [archaeon]
LYYRLNVVAIAVPPLRERMEDLPLLVAHFLEMAGAGPTALSEEAFGVLRAYRWPGNVRELRNAVEHAVVLARGRTIGLEHLPPDVLRGGPGRTPGEAIGRLVCEELERLRAAGVAEPWERLLEMVEAPLVRQALALTGGNQVQASAMLGIHRTTLRKKMERFGLLGDDTPRGASPEG